MAHSDTLTTCDGNPLLDYFIHNTQHAIHKPVSFFSVYHRYLNQFRNRPIKHLEIGVQNGGSLHMWRNYYGEQASIIGADIDPNCRVQEKNGYEVWIGDQASPAFWDSFKLKHNSLDVVLDDGGHTMVQQINTFKALFPILKEGGIFIVEDTNSSYYPKLGGGLGKPNTFLQYARSLVDDIHASHHAKQADIANNYFAKHLYSVSFYDGIVVFEKRQRNPFLILSIGDSGHIKNPIAMTAKHMRELLGVEKE